MFIWDSFNTNHIALHAVSTEEAEQVINNNPFDVERQIRNGEVRFLYLGETLSGRILFVVVTQRGNDLRVVTAFAADRQARKFYTEQKELEDAKKNRNPGI